MKANELMLYDWVMDNRANTPLKVNPFMAQLDVPEWSPIPLTPEILVANGWWVDDYDETRYHLGNDGTLEIEEWQSGLQSYDIPAMKFRFVHELQHALRLCGLNDLADNFKLA